MAKRPVFLNMARAKRHYIPDSGRRLLFISFFPGLKNDIDLEKTCFFLDVKIE
jgi:hypothetical protein